MRGHPELVVPALQALEQDGEKYLDLCTQSKKPTFLPSRSQGRVRMGRMKGETDHLVRNGLHLVQRPGDALDEEPHHALARDFVVFEDL
jgi:hypothetical protein